MSAIQMAMSLDVRSKDAESSHTLSCQQIIRSLEGEGVGGEGVARRERSGRREGENL